MKRLIILLLTLFLITAPVLADSSSIFDYTDDILEDGSPVYYFGELSLRLPPEWNGKVMAMQKKDGVYFYQRASYYKFQEKGSDGGGFLFMLGASVNHSFTQLPSYKYLGFSEASAMNYYLMLPTDYRAYNDPVIRAEYDAMNAQIDYVAEHAEFYNAQDASGKESGEAPALADVRYYFEHILLPKYFYDVPDKMLDVIKKSGLYVLWESIALENGVDPTYPAEKYTEHWYTCKDGTTLLQAELPEPDANVLCYRVYFLYNAKTGKVGYYTAESDVFMPDAAFLCIWTPEGEHQIRGSVKITDRESSDYEKSLQTEAEEIARIADVQLVK